jgi:cell division inhibitor SepF
MGLRDTWHRALVYFGLAEEPEYEYDDRLAEQHEPETGEEPIERSSRGRRGRSARRLERTPPRDEIDDIFSDDDAPAGSRTRVLRPVSNGGADVQVHLVTPRNFNDAQEVADRFKRSIPVILNLQATGADLSKRLIDFASGLTYALDGGMQKIAEKTFLLTPQNVEVSAEERARLVKNDFFNQS